MDKNCDLEVPDDIEWCRAWTPFKEAVLRRSSWYALTKCLCRLNRQWRWHCKSEARERCRRVLTRLQKRISTDYLPKMRISWSPTAICNSCKQTLNLRAPEFRVYKLLYTRTQMRNQKYASDNAFLCGTCYYENVCAGEAHMTDYALLSQRTQPAEDRSHINNARNAECIGRPQYASLLLDYSVPQRYDLKSLFVCTAPSALQKIVEYWFGMLWSGQTEVRFNRLFSKFRQQQDEQCQIKIDLAFRLCVGNLWDWVPVAWLHVSSLNRNPPVRCQAEYCPFTTVTVLQCCNPSSRFYGNRHYFHNEYWYSSLRRLQQCVLRESTVDRFDLSDSEETTTESDDDFDV